MYTEHISVITVVFLEQWIITLDDSITKLLEVLKLLYIIFWHFRNDKNDKAPSKYILRGGKQAVSTDVCVKLSAFPLFFTFHEYFTMYILFLVMYLFSYYQPSHIPVLLRSDNWRRFNKIGLFTQLNHPWENLFYIFKLIKSHFIQYTKNLPISC